MSLTVCVFCLSPIIPSSHCCCLIEHCKITVNYTNIMDIIKNEDAYADNIHPIEDILSVQFIKCELIDSKVEYLLNMSDPKEVFQKQFSVLNLQIAEAILKVSDKIYIFSDLIRDT